MHSSQRGRSVRRTESNANATGQGSHGNANKKGSNPEVQIPPFAAPAPLTRLTLQSHNGVYDPIDRSLSRISEISEGTASSATSSSSSRVLAEAPDSKAEMQRHAESLDHRVLLLTNSYLTILTKLSQLERNAIIQQQKINLLEQYAATANAEQRALKDYVYLLQQMIYANQIQNYPHMLNTLQLQPTTPVQTPTPSSPSTPLSPSYTYHNGMLFATAPPVQPTAEDITQGVANFQLGPPN